MESPPIPPVSTAGEESPARIRFVVHPWAEVEVEGHAPFLTPRAEPVSLAPGDHEVEYRHPRLGTVRRRFHVDSGEERVIRELLIDESAS